MTNLKSLSEREIIKRAKDYESRIIETTRDMRLYLEHGNGSEEELKQRYSDLKEEVVRESHYLRHHHNSIAGLSPIHEAYERGIIECAEYAFMAKAGGTITKKTLFGLDDAEERLTHYIKFFDEWEDD